MVTTITRTEKYSLNRQTQCRISPIQNYLERSFVRYKIQDQVYQIKGKIQEQDFPLLPRYKIKIQKARFNSYLLDHVCNSYLLDHVNRQKEDTRSNKETKQSTIYYEVNYFIFLHSSFILCLRYRSALKSTTSASSYTQKSRLHFFVIGYCFRSDTKL